MADITVETRELPTFIRKKHELDKLLKSLEKESDAVMTVLLDLMTNDKTSEKLKADIALELLRLRVKTVEVMNNDALARQVAEAKLAGPKGTTVPLEGGKQTPALNFEDVREV